MYYVSNGLQEDTVVPQPPHLITNLLKLLPACFHGNQMLQNLLEEVNSGFSFSIRKSIGKFHPLHCHQNTSAVGVAIPSHFISDFTTLFYRTFTNETVATDQPSYVLFIYILISICNLIHTS